MNTTTMGGDPAPGATKTLTLKVRTNRGIRTARIGNSTTLKLPNIAWDSGLIDRQFRPQNTETLSLADAAPQPDGKIIIHGSFTKFAGATIRNITRLLPDGSVDTGFTTVQQFSSPSFNTVRVDSSGFIYVGGFILKPVNSSTARGLFRLLPDGTIDSSFNAPESLDWIDLCDPHPDGTVWCSGYFNSFDAPRNYIARLLHDGSIDARFNTSDALTRSPASFTLEPPNKLWVCTSVSDAVNGQLRDGIICFNLTSPISPFARLVPSAVATTEGGTARFLVADPGNGETYAWLRNGNVITDATGPSLTISNAQPTDSGIYSFIATNAVGSNTSAGSLSVEEFTLEAWLGSHGISPAQADEDQDGDGATNRAEYIARTNPLSRESSFAAKTTPIADGLRLSWPTYPGRNYVVEKSNDLIHWEPAFVPVAGTGADRTQNISFDSEQPRQFWRVNISKP